jgi:hypothetical protein
VTRAPVGTPQPNPNTYLELHPVADAHAQTLHAELRRDRVTIYSWAADGNFPLKGMDYQPAKLDRG